MDWLAALLMVEKLVAFVGPVICNLDSSLMEMSSLNSEFHLILERILQETDLIPNNLVVNGRYNLYCFFLTKVQLPWLEKRR